MSDINFLTVVVLILIAAGVFFALRAIFVKKKGRCGGSCDDCPYKTKMRCDKSREE